MVAAASSGSEQWRRAGCGEQWRRVRVRVLATEKAVVSLGEWFSEGIPEVKSAGLRLFDKRQFDFGAHCSVSKECSLAQRRRRHDDRSAKNGHHHCCQKNFTRRKFKEKSVSTSSE